MNVDGLLPPPNPMIQIAIATGPSEQETVPQCAPTSSVSDQPARQSAGTSDIAENGGYTNVVSAYSYSLYK